MKCRKISKEFRKGHTYFSQTRQGKIRLFEVTKVYVRTATGEHVSVAAKYDGKPEMEYEIKRNKFGDEWIIVDNRFCTVVDTLEIIDDVTITDDMISNIHEFNNCGQCTVTVDGKSYEASWNHGEVTADETIKDAFKAYIYG